jgi:hypothetical protein
MDRHWLVDRRRWMKIKLHVRLRWILFVILLPFVLLGVLVLAVAAYDLVRHDPAYFADAYRERYSTPGEAARALEGVLQRNDEAMLAELQGLRWPAEFYASPDMIFVMLLEHTDRYITYLYFDMQTYERHPHYFEEVDGRWVVAPTDAAYYVHSGQWQRVFWPLAIVWWLLGVVTIGMVWLFRASARARARLYGEE